MTLNQQLVSDKSQTSLFPKYGNPINFEESSKRLANIVNSLEKNFNKFQNKKHMYYCLTFLERVKEDFVSKNSYHAGIYKKCQFVSRLIKKLHSYKKLTLIQKEELLSMVIEVLFKPHGSMQQSTVQLFHTEKCREHTAFVIGTIYILFSMALEDKSNIKPPNIEYEKLLNNELLKDNFEGFDNYYSLSLKIPLNVLAIYLFFNRQYYKEIMCDEYYRYVLNLGFTWAQNKGLKYDFYVMEKCIREDHFLNYKDKIEILFSALFFNNEDKIIKIVNYILGKIDQ